MRGQRLQATTTTDAQPRKALRCTSPPSSSSIVTIIQPTSWFLRWSDFN